MASILAWGLVRSIDRPPAAHEVGLSNSPQSQRQNAVLFSYILLLSHIRNFTGTFCNTFTPNQGKMSNTDPSGACETMLAVSLSQHQADEMLGMVNSPSYNEISQLFDHCWYHEDPSADTSKEDFRSGYISLWNSPPQQKVQSLEQGWNAIFSPSSVPFSPPPSCIKMAAQAILKVTSIKSPTILSHCGLSLLMACVVQVHTYPMVKLP